MTLLIIFTIIVTHFVADFVAQTHWQATNKSKNNIALTEHVASYSAIWLVVVGIIAILSHNLVLGLFFAPITFACHWVTDYFTSRLNSYLWAKGDVHNFFVSVGFDQVLHYVQLFLTYYLLTVTI